MAVAGDPVDLVLEEVAARQRQQRRAPSSSTVVVARGSPPTSTLFVIVETSDGQLEELRLLRELLLDRAHELLLARDPVVVVVGVAVADEVERLLAASAAGSRAGC